MAEKKGNEKKENTKKKNKTSRPKRRFRINKKIEGKTGTIFIGHEDPFLYFPDNIKKDLLKSVKILLILFFQSCYKKAL